MKDLLLEPSVFLATHVNLPLSFSFKGIRAFPVETFFTSPSGPIQVTFGGGFPSALQESTAGVSLSCRYSLTITTTVAETEKKGQTSK